ncbi:ComF family protein [Acidocella sp.]|uniref:ComF family protein n=1 Tax=Acidocella sp. TaxID=50710 RepID=UPI00260DB1D2|nr:double zinc ribbon domain-containing protein [Acidocella sp.]
MKPLLRWMLDTVLPPSCLACDAPVEREGQFCLNCFRAANFITEPVCALCGVPMGPGGGGCCAPCLAQPRAFASARAALSYDDTARKLLLPLKYADHTEAVRGLAELMRRPGREMIAACTLIVPVPLHLSRLRGRRFNQAALLAVALARAAARPVDVEALERVRATAPLEGLGLSARAAELSGAIRARAGARLAGQRVLLIDDVMTSGATADECARALLAGGAARVEVLTVARVGLRDLPPPERARAEGMKTAPRLGLA